MRHITLASCVTLPCSCGVRSTRCTHVIAKRCEETYGRPRKSTLTVVFLNWSQHWANPKRAFLVHSGPSTQATKQQQTFRCTPVHNSVQGFVQHPVAVSCFVDRRTIANYMITY